MGEVAVYEHIGPELTEIPNAAPYFKEGDTGHVLIYMDHQLTQEELYKFEQDLIAQGAVLTGPVTQSDYTIVIPFYVDSQSAQTGVNAQFVLGLWGALLIAGAVLAAIVGWVVVRPASQAGIPLWVWVVGGFFLLLLFLSSSSTKKTAGYITGSAVKGYGAGLGYRAYRAARGS